MAVEEHRLRIRRSLEEKLGVEEASYLMDRPPGGWSDLVTNQTLDLKLEALEHRLTARITELSASVDRRLRAQTWIMVTSLITGLGLLGAVLRI